MHLTQLHFMLLILRNLLQALNFINARWIRRKFLINRLSVLNAEWTWKKLSSSNCLQPTNNFKNFLSSSRSGENIFF